jgi:K+-transporting ATPase ATPase C chain
MFTLLTGVIYPLVIAGVARVLFSGQAAGTLVKRGGVVVGSELIGQPFSSAGYFWGRPSPTAPSYHGGASAGSNLGPLNPALHQRVSATVSSLRAAHGEGNAVPVDLATASGSGLDPHVSPAAALYQVGRVAAARGLSEEAVRQLVDEHTQARQLGFLGEPRVNVLLLNLALDDLDRGAASSGARSGGR